MDLRDLSEEKHCRKQGSAAGRAAGAAGAASAEAAPAAARQQSGRDGALPERQVQRLGRARRGVASQRSSCEQPALSDVPAAVPAKQPVALHRFSKQLRINEVE